MGGGDHAFKQAERAVDRPVAGDGAAVFQEGDDSRTTPRAVVVGAVQRHRLKLSLGDRRKPLERRVVPLFVPGAGQEGGAQRPRADDEPRIGMADELSLAQAQDFTERRDDGVIQEGPALRHDGQHQFLPHGHVGKIGAADGEGQTHEQVRAKVRPMSRSGAG